MLIHGHFTINHQNHLEIGGCDTVALAKKYGTPLYVMDEERIRQNMRAYQDAIRADYDGHGQALYASKAFSCIAMLKIAAQEGMGLDVVSGGELFTAKKAHFPMDQVYFHGNNKSPEELCMAVEYGVGKIVVDNERELLLLNDIAKENGVTQDILFRIKPGVDAHTHKFIRTGQIDSKFGVALENGEAFAIVKQAASLEHIRVVGVHCHIGSQIFELEPFVVAARVMAEFMAKVNRELGIVLTELNLGGGFGIQYVKGDQPVRYPEYIKAVSETLREQCKALDIPLPRVLMEPGRSIVGDAGVTLYTIGTVKDIKNVRKYVSVDGGMTDNPRYILYQAEYDAAVANRADAAETETVTICGKCCESGDIVMQDAKLPKLSPGDILAVMSTGAYNYSMASNYNRLPRPAVVFVKDGKDRLAVRRETYEDLVSHDVE